MAAVTPTASVEEFLDTIERSGLLPAEAMAKARQAGTKTTDPKRLARDLIKDGSLTKWQATQLLHNYSALVMGRYELLDDLGPSGLARVYLVEHVQMKRRHALKVLSKRQTAQPQIVKQFLADAQQACQLEHPNLSRIYDVNQDGERYYIVMEHVEGQTLDRLVGERGRLEPAEALSFALQAAAGLAHAHGQGVVHGDLKPANLLLDSTGTIKILEIGQSRMGSMAAGSQGAKPADDAADDGSSFRAPEVRGGETIPDARSDIYSLGSILCFVLLGKPFINANAAAEQLNQVTGLPADVARLAVRLMAEQPAGRPQSMAEVGELLASAATEMPSLEIKVDEEADAKGQSGALPVAQRMKAPAAEATPGFGGFTIETANRTPKKAAPAPAAKAAAGQSKPISAEGSKERPEKSEPSKAEPDTESEVAPQQQKKSYTPLVIAGAIGGGGVLALAGILALVFAFFSRPGEKQVAQKAPTANPQPAAAAPPPAAANETNPPTTAEVNPEVNPTVEPGAAPAIPAPPPAEAKPIAKEAPAAATAASPAPPVKTEANPAKTEKKVEAKPEAKPAPQPMPTKTEPPKPAPPPAPKAPSNPLAGFAKEVALPELPLMGEPVTAVLSPFELGPCKVDDKSPVAARLLGGDVAIRGGKQKFDLLAAADSAGRQWGFQLVGGDGAATIATLSVQKGKLLFQWSPEAAKQAAAANMLCNCALEVQAGPGKATVQLRKPVLGTPLAVQIEKTGETAKWVIPNLPDPKHVRVQILRCEGLKSYRLEPSEAVVTGNDITLWAGPEEKQQVVALKLDTSASLKGINVASAPQLRLVPDARPQRYNKKEFTTKWDPLESTCRHASLSIL